MVADRNETPCKSKNNSQPNAIVSCFNVLRFFLLFFFFIFHCSGTAEWNSAWTQINTLAPHQLIFFPARNQMWQWRHQLVFLLRLAFNRKRHSWRAFSRTKCIFRWLPSFSKQKQKQKIKQSKPFMSCINCALRSDLWKWIVNSNHSLAEMSWNYNFISANGHSRISHSDV